MSIFLRRWPDALRPSENSIQSHMVSYCSVIKCEILVDCDSVNVNIGAIIGADESRMSRIPQGDLRVL